MKRIIRLPQYPSTVSYALHWSANSNNKVFYFIGTITAVLLWLFINATMVWAQNGKTTLRVDGEEKSSGAKITTSSELLLETSFLIKRVKILRKNINEYKLESYIDVRPPSKIVGIILAVSANKIKSGDQVQLLLIPDNETQKISDTEGALYLNVE